MTGPNRFLLGYKYTNFMSNKGNKTEIVYILYLRDNRRGSAFLERANNNSWKGRNLCAEVMS